MPIPFLPTETSFEVKCPVCDRGFLLLSAPTLVPYRGGLRRAARRALLEQHRSYGTADARVHPEEVFDLPGWDGETEGAAAEEISYPLRGLDLLH